MGVGIYAGLWLALGGEVMLPFGVGWSVFLIWACAHVGGYAATQVQNLPSPACTDATKARRAVALIHCWSVGGKYPSAPKSVRGGGLSNRTIASVRMFPNIQLPKDWNTSNFLINRHEK